MLCPRCCVLLQLFIGNVRLDLVSLERWFGYRQADLGKLQPYIWVNFGDFTHPVRTNIFRGDISSGNIMFNENLSITCLPTDTLYVFLVNSGGVMGKDQYLGYTSFPCSDIGTSPQVKDFTLSACDPKQPADFYSRGVPSGAASIGNIGWINLRYQQGVAAATADPSSLTSVAGKQSNIGSVPAEVPSQTTSSGMRSGGYGVGQQGGSSYGTGQQAGTTGYGVGQPGSAMGKVRSSARTQHDIA